MECQLDKLIESYLEHCQLIINQAERWKQLNQLEEYSISLREHIKMLSDDRQKVFNQYIKTIQDINDKESFYREIEDFVAGIK